jgi:hypothetical protein
MINKDRIVPVQATDLISLYGVILKQDTENNEGLQKLGVADDNAGFFIISDGDGLFLCNEPVKRMVFAGTAGFAYFVADYGFEGFFDGENAKITPVSGSVDPDGCSLYSAVYESGNLIINRIGLDAPSTGGGTEN